MAYNEFVHHLFGVIKLCIFHECGVEAKFGKGTIASTKSENIASCNQRCLDTNMKSKNIVSFECICYFVCVIFVMYM